MTKSNWSEPVTREQLPWFSDSSVRRREGRIRYRDLIPGDIILTKDPKATPYTALVVGLTARKLHDVVNIWRLDAFIIDKEFTLIHQECVISTEQYLSDSDLLKWGVIPYDG